MRIIISDPDHASSRIHEIPRPVPGRGQVLVRIEASGVNPLDLKILAGKAPHARHPLPATVGLDLAGRIEALGDHVQGFKVGDAVYGMTGGVGGIQGSLAEYAAVDAALLALRPERLTAREAAALPLVTITAWEGLIDQARLRADQCVLVHGGAGGVGHIAVQIARAFGARVAATGSDRHRPYIEGLGATFIGYQHEGVTAYVSRVTAARGFDLVYDTVGGSTLDASFLAVRSGGHVVSCLGWGTHALGPLSMRAATYSGVFTLLPLLTGEGRSRHGQILAEATDLVNAGKLMPRVDPREFSLETLTDAYRLLEGQKAEGKVVISIDH